MITKDCYHIYVNEKCVKANLDEEEFNKELRHIEAFLELTNLTEQATIDYEHCECEYSLAEASF